MIPTLKTLLTTTCIGLLTMASVVSQASTLKSVIDRDELICGVQGGFSGMSYISKDGTWSGFDVDFCKALASAILKDEELTDYIALSSRARFKALINNEIDVLIRNSTWTYERDAGLAVDFVGVSFYDGQSFIFNSNRGVRSIRDIKPKMTICVEQFSTIVKNLSEFNKLHKLNLKIVEFGIKSKAISTFLNGDCDAYSGESSDLYSQISMASLNPDDYVILPERISKEPMGPVVRDNDPEWSNIVRWVLFATIEAEEKGITSDNIRSLLKSNDPSIRYMLGVDPGIGKALGLDDKWLFRVITSVGNYSEIFERHFGGESNAPMDRGLNKLWSDGGILYSPPLN